jgi:hypothetical protein
VFCANQIDRTFRIDSSTFMSRGSDSGSMSSTTYVGGSAYVNVGRLPLRTAVLAIMIGVVGLIWFLAGFAALVLGTALVTGAGTVTVLGVGGKLAGIVVLTIGLLIVALLHVFLVAVSRHFNREGPAVGPKARVFAGTEYDSSPPASRGIFSRPFSESLRRAFSRTPERMLRAGASGAGMGLPEFESGSRAPKARRMDQ